MAFPTTEEGPFVENIHKESDVTMKRIASPVVIFERRVAVPLGPKRVWVLNPPRADKSAFLPDCKRTVITKKMHVITCKAINKVNNFFLLFLTKLLNHS